MRFFLNRGDWFNHQRSNGGNAASDFKYDELKQLVQQMSTDMGRRQQGITIVSSDHSRSASRAMSACVTHIVIAEIRRWYNRHSQSIVSSDHGRFASSAIQRVQW